jgi:hypothetical protein
MAKKKPKMPETNLRLRELMAERELTAARVAEMVGVTVHAIHSYTRTPGKPGFRTMPRPYLDLLCIKLGVKQQAA